MSIIIWFSPFELTVMVFVITDISITTKNKGIIFLFYDVRLFA
jgi:hypothetical protein